MLLFYFFFLHNIMFIYLTYAIYVHLFFVQLFLKQ